MPEEILKMPKVIADIAQRGGDNYSFFVGFKYECLGCELPTCNKCSVFEENEDVEK